MTFLVGLLVGLVIAAVVSVVDDLLWRTKLERSGTRRKTLFDFWLS